MTGSAAGTPGRYKSNGGATAAPDSAVTVAPVISAPPGACELAVARPSTWTTVSSGQASRASAAGPVKTTWARPERSRMMRNDTDFSCRRRCTHPAIITGSPTWRGRSAASTRDVRAAREVAWTAGTGSSAMGTLRWSPGLVSSQVTPGVVVPGGAGERGLAVPPHLRHQRPGTGAPGRRGPLSYCKGSGVSSPRTRGHHHSNGDSLGSRTPRLLGSVIAQDQGSRMAATVDTHAVPSQLGTGCDSAHRYKRQIRACGRGGSRRGFRASGRRGSGERVSR